MARVVCASLVVGALCVTATAAAEQGGGAPSPSTAPTGAPVYEQVAWRKSRALGRPWRGRLVNGVRLPAEGDDFFTWDAVTKRAPSRSWRRWGTDRLLRTLLDVLHEHRLAYPDAGRVGIGDLSRPRGGSFGSRFGGLGHVSHQNGLDVDVYYPRLDGLERRSIGVAQIDVELAQDLVDRFVAAGAQYVFVGPATGLVGPRGVVGKLRFHDDHMHVRVW